jgi:hypothetical protein
MPAPKTVTELVDEAIGKTHRADPVAPRTGGPAGNARFTAWTGLLLLALITVELVTLIDVRGLISWHIVVGTLLVPVGLLKTFATTWRFGRYYTGNRAYRSAGPPPTLLRILGPLVIVTTLGLLGSGLALIALGTVSSRRVIFTALGQRVDTLTLHQALFIAFAVATGLHVLARTVPAVIQVTGRLQRAGPLRHRVPGGAARLVALVATLTAAAITAALVLGASSEWRRDSGRSFRQPGVGGSVGP